MRRHIGSRSDMGGPSHIPFGNKLAPMVVTTPISQHATPAAAVRRPRGSSFGGGESQIVFGDDFCVKSLSKSTVKAQKQCLLLQPICLQPSAPKIEQQRGRARVEVYHKLCFKK